MQVAAIGRSPPCSGERHDLLSIILSTMLIEPRAEDKLHSSRLSRDIRRRIARRHGWVGFDQFMEQALYAPGLGYYSAGLPKFGAAGDFVTATVMGDVLARCLAGQCVEVLSEIGHGDVLEFGAGSGQLAADLLAAMAALGRLPQRYFILETSAALQARQRETIAARCASLGARVRWLEHLPPDGFDGVVLANEVLDAMPAIRFEIDAQGEALALGVAVAGEGFCWAQPADPLPGPLQERLAEYQLAAGYRSEIGLRAEAWVRSVGEKINTGVMLLVDYGFPRREFYHAERRHGTLMCHYRHFAHDDPFFYPGLQDISVHLDFTAISRAAREVALATAGFASQGAFLLSLGALDMLAECRGGGELNPRESLALSRQIQKLTMPHEMGELFKVIAFSRNYHRPLGGFSMHDRRGRL